MDSARPTSAESRPILGVAGLTAALVVFHLFLARHSTGPILYEDSLAYLAIARRFAGIAPLHQVDIRSFYHFGYSLLLAPLYLVLRSPQAVFRGALVLDAILASLQLPLLYLLGRRLLRLERTDALLAAAATALYTPFLLQSGFAWSESLFACAATLQVLLAFETLAGRRPRAIFAFAMNGAFLYAVHPRGLGIAAATALALLVWGARGAVPRMRAALALPLLVLGLAATRAVNHWLRAHVWLAQPKVLPSQEVLTNLFLPAQMAKLPLRMAGQAWYLLAATLGVALLGAAVLAWRSRKGWTGREPRAATAAFVLASAVAVFLASTLFLLPAWRTDHFVYGRYNEGVLPPILLAGLGALLIWPRRRALQLLALAFALFAELGVTLLGAFGRDAFAAPPNPLNVLGLSAFTLFTHHEGEIRIAALNAAVLVGMLGFTLLALVSRRLAVGTLALAFALAATGVEARILRPFSHTWSGMLALPHALERLGVDGPLAYDASNPEPYGWNAYLFWRDGLVLDRFSSAAGQAPARELVVASRAWPGAKHGARLVFAEKSVDQALWALPGAWQEKLAGRGLLVPLDPAVPLPPTARRAELRSEESAPLRLAPGEIHPLTLHLRHAGQGAIWMPLELVPGQRGAIRLGARWTPVGGASEVAVQITELPRVLLPGDRAELTLPLAARTSSGTPLPRGAYRVRIALLQEGIGWLDEPQGGALVIPLEVS